MKVSGQKKQLSVNLIKSKCESNSNIAVSAEKKFTFTKYIENSDLKT